MIFGTVREGILEILDERLDALRTEAMTILEVSLFLFVSSRLVELSSSLGRRTSLPVGDG